MEKVNSRSLYWDIVKGVSILLVIIGHCLQWSCGTGLDFIDNDAYVFIYGFHMSLFMLISGYFFYYSVQRHYSIIIIKNRLRQCLLPILTMSIIAQMMLLRFTPILMVDRIFGTSLWFLWVIFYLSFLMLLLKNAPPTILVLIYFITFILPTFHISVYVWYMYPYFVCGYLFNKYKVFENVFEKRQILLIITVICGLVYLLLLKFFTKDTFIYWADYTLLDGGGLDEFITNIQRTITGFSGTFFLIGLLRLTYSSVHNYVQICLSYLGRYTLQLYVISTLPVFNFTVRHFGSGQVDYLLAICASIIVVIVSLVIIKILSSFQILNLLCFGQKYQSVKGIFTHSLNKK